MKAMFLAAAAAAALAASPAAAQSVDGALSSTSSTGTFDVTVNVDEMVRVSGLDALTLNIDPATLASNFGSTSAITQFCVYSNVDAAGSYNVQVTGAPGDGLGNPYGLTGVDTGTRLDHTVGYWDNATYNSVAATFMRSSTVRASENTRNGQARSTTTDCSSNGLGGSNSSIRVTVRNANAIAALADTYEGTLSVIVSVP